MEELKVEKWIPYKGNLEEYKRSAGGLGGFFKKGMRWKDYMKEFPPSERKYLASIKDSILKLNIREGGDWHQSEENNGVPLFTDGTIATFSYRAWGDLLAATWSTAEDKDYAYMDFYMSNWPNSDYE